MELLGFQIVPYYGVGYKVLKTSERFAEGFEFHQTYPSAETRNINYLITTSYPFQLEYVRFDVFCHHQ